MKSSTKLERHTLQETTVEKDLGVYISNNLKWKNQVDHSVQKANALHSICPPASGIRQQRVVSVPETRHLSHRKSLKKSHQNGSWTEIPELHREN